MLRTWTLNKDSQQRFVKFIFLSLLLIFAIKLAGFFSWSDNPGITQLLKLTSRISMTIFIILLQGKILRKGAVASFKWQHSLIIIFYCAYLFLALISFFWSTDKRFSALQWFMDIESLVFAFYFVRVLILMQQFFPNNKITLPAIISHASFFLIGIFVIGMYLAPNVFFSWSHGGEELRLGGLLMNPNEMGMLCVVGISCALFEWYGKRGSWLSILQISIMTFALIMTGSRSSLVGLMMVLFLHISRSSKKGLKLILYGGVVAVIPMVVTKLFIAKGGLEEVLSMTGRIPFWKAMLTEGLPKQPWLGFGFMRISNEGLFSSVHTYSADMPHNTFIAVLMNLGFVGFFIALFQLVFFVRGWMHCHDARKKLAIAGLFIPILINSFTEFGIFGLTNYGILFYQIIFFYVAIEFNPVFSKREKLFLTRIQPDRLLERQASPAPQ